MATRMLLPQWTPAMIVLHGVLGAFALAIGPLAKSGLLKMRYSKFRTGEGISGRTGMFILYFVPLVVLFLSAFACGLLPGATALQWVLLGVVGGHFVKRCLEVLFVHVYSGPIDLMTVTMVSLNYSLLTGLAPYFLRQSPPVDLVFWAGAALFAVGELGNLYHHLLLARLRRTEQSYFIPTGGLFGAVSAPHYLFELVAWLGFALMGRHLIFFIAFAVMAHYLTNRAAEVQAWYRAKFPEYPKDRRCILPGVY
jgi:hypothetical protein